MRFEVGDHFQRIMQITNDLESCLYPGFTCFSDTLKLEAHLLTFFIKLCV